MQSVAPMRKPMQKLVEDLCSPECAGRRPGTPGGLRARKLVLDAFREAGLDPEEQPIQVAGGANVVAKLEGDIDRWVLVAAHFDHLGATKDAYFPGADDNATAVAILVEVARSLVAKRADGRGIIVAAFDAEEAPYFLTDQMGSAFYAKHARETIDMMVCMDLVGHSLGFEGLPDSVRGSLFALGAERSKGTAAIVDGMACTEEGLFVRRADAEIIEPLSDYDAFWRRAIPFLFLTCGRSARYHTPADTPEHVDYAKCERTARWLERFVRNAAARDDEIAFMQNTRDDASSLASFADLVAPLAALSPIAAEGADRAKDLLEKCDASGRLPSALKEAPSELLLALENALA